MFEVYDIVSSGIIFIILFFLFILFQIEKSFTRPRVYLRAALFIALLILINDELISLQQYSLAIIIYPLHIASLFVIYPLIYVYSRNLIFSNRELQKGNHHPLRFILILPALVLFYLAFIFYPLDYDSKVQFMNLHLTESSREIPGFTFYQYAISIAYYLQTSVYMIITLRLVSVARKNIHSKLWELLLVKYILMYVVAVILYEFIIAGCSIFFSENITVLKAAEQLLTLLFISLGLYIAFKQSLIIIQSRIHKYADKLTEPGPEIQFNNSEEQMYSTDYRAVTGNGQLNQKVLLSEDEKQEIKEAIAIFFTDSKIYLDPNLKLEQLSRKLHIPARKISMVINEVYGNNFNHFINEYRILEAKKLISRNPENVIIENIYTKVGFNSRSSFNRVFKESTGVSPIDYIKNSPGTKTETKAEAEA